MTSHDLPRGMIRATVTTGTHEGYMPGFGNDFETEALPGALPQGMNSPQKCNYGLYGEQLSGTAFTANPPERTWCYRIRPSVKHSARYHKIALPYWKSAPNVNDDVTSLGQYRWDPVPHSGEKLTWLTGMRTITTAGDAMRRAHSSGTSGDRAVISSRRAAIAARPRRMRSSRSMATRPMLRAKGPRL